MRVGVVCTTLIIPPGTPNLLQGPESVDFVNLFLNEYYFIKIDILLSRGPVSDLVGVGLWDPCTNLVSKRI